VDVAGYATVFVVADGGTDVHGYNLAHVYLFVNIIVRYNSFIYDSGFS